MSNKEKETIEDYGYYIFHSEFDRKSSSNFIEYVIERNLKKDVPEIKMIINSPGGECQSMFAMVDTMKGSKIPILTFGIGEISSCGLMTFIAGEKGKRYITPNTSILSHQFSWGSRGKEHELFSTVKEFENTSDRILQHYKKCTGLSEKDIKKYLLPAHDVWLSAKEAIKYGIADKIVSFY